MYQYWLAHRFQLARAEPFIRVIVMLCLVQDNSEGSVEARGLPVHYQSVLLWPILQGPKVEGVQRNG
jgi:hypothetical protein